MSDLTVKLQTYVPYYDTLEWGEFTFDGTHFTSKGTNRKGEHAVLELLGEFKPKGVMEVKIVSGGPMYRFSGGGTMFENGGTMKVELPKDISEMDEMELWDILQKRTLQEAARRGNL